MSSAEQERSDIYRGGRPVRLSSRRRPLGDPHLYENIERLRVGGFNIPVVPPEELPEAQEDAQVEPPIAQTPVRLLLGNFELL